MSTDPSQKKTVPIDPDKLGDLLSQAGIKRQGDPAPVTAAENSPPPEQQAPAPPPKVVPPRVPPMVGDPVSPLGLTPEQILALSQRMNIPCPHCGKTASQPACTITDDDRREWFRSLLGDRPFARKFSLQVGGTEEFSAMYATLSADHTTRKERVEMHISKQEVNTVPRTPEFRELVMAKALFQALSHCIRLGNKEFGPELILSATERMIAEETEAEPFNLYVVMSRLVAEGKMTEMYVSLLMQMHTHFHSMVTTLLSESVNGTFTVGAGPA